MSKLHLIGRVIARRLVVPCIVLFLCGVSGSLTRATEDPVIPPPDVETLTVAKDNPGGSVVLTWSDGAAPFAIVRSTSSDFLNPTGLTYVSVGTPLSTINDPVLADGETYFYLVEDVNAPTQVYEINHTNPIPYEGDILTIDGVGFSDNCPDNAFYLEGGLAATLTSCSSTQIQAEVPVHAVSGNVVVVAPNGQSTPRKKLFAVGINTNPPKTEIAHINVDANNNIFVTDQGSADRIWKLDFTTGVAQTCTMFGNPVGLPMNMNGKFNYSNDTWSAFNQGTVRELDPANCSSVLWGPAGMGSTDPVDPRALAYDKSGANDDWIFVLDHWGDRIRRRGDFVGMDTTWLTGLNLGGDTAAASRPAGLTFDTAGEFFFTAQNTIQHYDASKTLVQAFTQTDGVDHPAQIETDENDTLWVANRDGNNVLRIRTDPANNLVREKVSGIMSPRGLALDRDPNTNDPWLYVADQTEIYRFRVYDTLHVNITVLEEALTSPLSGTVTSKAEFERRVRRDFSQARTIFTQCGIEMVLEGITFVTDPNSNSGRVSTGSVCTALPTTQTQTLLGTNRSANPLAVNVYYINHFLISGMPISRNGESITNDCYTNLNNQTGGGVIVARFSALPGGMLAGGAVDNTVAHEMGHFLLNNFANPVGPSEHRSSGCGTSPDRFHIMHGSGCSTRYTLDPLECTDIRTNMDESEFVELF